MRLKDVKVGEVYLVVPYGQPVIPRREAFGADSEHRGWRELDRSGLPGRVLEAGVKVPHYRRPGVRVQPLDKGTLEPLRYGEPGTTRGRDDGVGELVKPMGVLAVSLLMPWQEFHAAYHDFLDASAEAEAARRDRREREEAEQRERQARQWMERAFSGARDAIEQVGEACGMELVVTDERVRRLVELRNPDGNPYLSAEVIE
jgi:hypothetical protein